MTAIVSTAPAIDADEREVAYAVANVVAFGLFGMLVYPYLAHALLQRSETVGLFLGTAVHDTSQVVGAALTYRQMYADDVVLRVATVTKLTRNLFLAGVIPLLTWMHLRATHASTSGQSVSELEDARADVRRRLRGDGLVRTLGDLTLQSAGAAYGVWDAAAWSSLTNQIGDFWASRVFLGTAMAAVGLNTSFAVFKGVGAKPFAVGFAGARDRRQRRHGDGDRLRPVRVTLGRAGQVSSQEVVMKRCTVVSVMLGFVLLSVPALAQDQFFDSKGVRIRYVVQGEGEPVVLMHGNGGRLEAWVDTGVMPNLARSYRVIAFDARGHGKSGKPHETSAYGREMGLDAIRLLDHLRDSARPYRRLFDGRVDDGDASHDASRPVPDCDAGRSRRALPLDRRGYRACRASKAARKRRNASAAVR